MTTEFDELFADGGPADSLLAQFGESITYTPIGGSAATVTAIVTRRPAVEISGTRVEVPVEFMVKQADVPTLSLGRDRVWIKRAKQDAAADEFRVVGPILSQDGGMYRLKVN